ncbi:UNVERIFIED_CONTAM: putative 1-phosphatidylinositol-3-phosphate 5-kinase FAB1C [Sesamum radiatum]|uniref:1-phosphatidylinositol-3-phosphate 5-kinase FAB1C n=1 Tax=Sesamum radiatum TaxID=300843 RepID=A0AAW2TXF0_SESRA
MLSFAAIICRWRPPFLLTRCQSSSNRAKSSHFTAETMTLDKAISIIPDSAVTATYGEEVDDPLINTGSADLNLELGLQESLSALGEVDDVSVPDEFYRSALSEACDENLALDLMLSDMRRTCPSIRTHIRTASLGQVEGQSGELAAAERSDGAEASIEYCSANDNNESILVSFSSHCILNGTACERSRLLRVKFYGPSDKPLGRFLRDDLFDKASWEQDGKIWMWHRCLRCLPIEGVPPATRRVVMSDAAGAFLLESFLNLAFQTILLVIVLQAAAILCKGTASGLEVWLLSSSILLLTYFLFVCPLQTLEFSSPKEQSWLRKEASEDSLQLADEEILEHDRAEIDILEINRLRHSLLIGSHVWDRRLYLLDSLQKRSSSPKALPDVEALIGLKDSATYYKDCSPDLGHDYEIDEPDIETRGMPGKALPANDEEPKPEPDMQESDTVPEFLQKEGDGVYKYEENAVNSTSLERLPSAASILSDKIDSAWCGAGQALMTAQLPNTLSADLSEAISVGNKSKRESIF